MKKTMTMFAIFMIAGIIAVGQSDYKMLELVYLKPVPGADLEAATKKLAEHNKKYHSADPFKASVWSNFTGSMAGTWVWAMYPATFSDYDNRTNMKEHDKDWDQAVSPYFTMEANEYWKIDDKLSYWPEGFKEEGKVVWTVFDIRPGDGYRFTELLKKVSEVYKQKKYNYNFVVYHNMFDNKAGRDVAIEVMFGKFAFLDEDHSLKKDYEEVHGEGSWWKLIEEFRDVVVSSEDELSVKMPEMSIE